MLNCLSKVLVYGAVVGKNLQHQRNQAFFLLEAFCYVKVFNIIFWDCSVKVRVAVLDCKGMSSMMRSMITLNWSNLSMMRLILV